MGGGGSATKAGQIDRSQKKLLSKNPALLGLTNQRVQPREDSAACHNLLDCKYSPTFEDFSVLCHQNEKKPLELKETLLIMRDRPSMNRSINSIPLHLFE